MILYKLSDFSSESNRKHQIKIVFQNNELELKLDTLTNKIVFSENSENISTLKDISFTFEIDRNPFINDSTIDKGKTILYSEQCHDNTISSNVCIHLNDEIINMPLDDNSIEVLDSESTNHISILTSRQRKARMRVYFSFWILFIIVCSLIGCAIWAIVKSVT